MKSILEEILAAGVAITDGAWGTQLQALGLETGEFPDSWNITHPEKVRGVAAAYVEAGSSIVLTNTFGANRLRMADHGSTDDLIEINRCGVRLSKEAAADRARVFASIGPTGKMLMNGDVTSEEMRKAFLEQAQALADAGADALVVETMADLDEARLAVEAAATTRLPVVGCMVFDSGREKDRTMMGITPEQAAKGLADAGADVIGANCGQGIAGFVPICKRLRASTQLPIWIKANAGLPTMINGRVCYQTTPEEFAGHLPALLQAGASFVGGCCGTSPEFIRALAKALPR